VRDWASAAGNRSNESAVLELSVDTTFRRTYECRSLTELPSSERRPRYYYPGASREGGRDGPILEVRPEHGEPWIGLFAFGAFGSLGVSGLFTTPHAGRLCVVTRGEGYLVAADDPTSWESVKAWPILDVRPVQARGILVFADYTDLMAYGETGLKWRSRLVTDYLKITEITDRLIRGEGYVLGREGVSFVVDLATGAHEGGLTDP
jgi:hypothetical protein